MFFNSCTGDQVSLYHSHFLNSLVENLKEVYRNKHIAIIATMVNLKNCERFFSQ